MQNNKWGGKRLLKKEYNKKKSRCRWLSLLLSLCMVVSLFGSVFSFPTLAREIEQTEPRKESWEKIKHTEANEETMEEIKTRLLWQIKEEGWDPYSEDMSVDEFYALMELLQEGTLPLKGEDQALEVSDTELSFN